MLKEETRLGLWRILLILGGLSLVEAAVRVGWINPFFLASPLQAVAVLWSEVVGGNALFLTLVTLYEIGCALFISTVVGLFAGFILWRYRLIGASYEMLLAALFPAFGPTGVRHGGLALFLVPEVHLTVAVAQHAQGHGGEGGGAQFRRAQGLPLARAHALQEVGPQRGRVVVGAPVFPGERLRLTYILKSVLGLEYVVQVGGVGMWLSDAAFRFEVGEVYAGLVGTVLLSVLFLYMINRAELLVRR